jgi:hypothetical protein
VSVEIDCDAVKLICIQIVVAMGIRSDGTVNEHFHINARSGICNIG